MGRKAKEIIFQFTGNSDCDMTTLRRGKLHCDICVGWYKSPHVEVCLHGFTICPSCIKAGPAALATKATRIAGDKDWIWRVWDLKDQEGLESFTRAYRELAERLRGIRSFEDLPGGKMALGVAGVLQAPAAGRKRRAA